MVKHATARLLQGSILDEQIELETAAVEEGVARYRQLAREAAARGDGGNLKPAERLQLHWYKPFVQAIRTEQRACRKEAGGGRGRQVYGPYLAAIGAPQLAVITMHQMLGQCLAEWPEGVPVIRLAYAIGRDALAEQNLLLAKEQVPKDVKFLERRYRRVTPQRVNRLARAKAISDPEWQRGVCIHIGTQLIWLLIGTASTAGYTDDKFELSFHHKRIRARGRTTAYIFMDDRAHDIIEDGHSARALLRPRYLPMVVQPYRWTDDAQGGYVKIRTPYISKPTPLQKEALAKADLTEINQCLDAVGAQSWRINPRIYNVMTRIWESGGGMVGLPHAEDFPLPDTVDTDDEAAIRANKMARAETYSRNVALRSFRREWMLKLDVASRMLDKHEIFFPHQFDFRTRTYPIPVHLNHQGDDVCRGILEFAHGKPADHRWLLIHAANCYGVDKVSFSDREAWANENLAAILASAANPLAVEFWQKAEKPWEFLSACIAIANPEHGMRMPVQMDGTCNGLQHYVGLGRDAEGAAVVNMLPADRPADVYSAVARDVGRLVAFDAQAGCFEAQVIADAIERKTVKQVVMTSVYGVTMVGARAQIYAALDHLALDDVRRYKVSAYLSRKVLDGIGTVCPGARRIMDWLTAVGKIVVANPRGAPISWTTPLGFPVLQPYRNYRKATVRTILQAITMLVPDDAMPVRAGKQVDAFSPNFIHSLDATHMLMTARACRAARVDFAAVHDSYWTHAGTVDQMAKILRDQFIALYEQPILDNLLAAMRSKYPDATFPDTPPQGDYDIKNVGSAMYFFS